MSESLLISTDDATLSGIIPPSKTIASKKMKIHPCWVWSVLRDFCFPWVFMSRISQQRRILGEAIRKYRKRAKMSQEKLAEKANLHPVYIGKVERGEQWISLHALLRIAKAVGVRVRDLVSGL